LSELVDHLQAAVRIRRPGAHKIIAWCDLEQKDADIRISHKKYRNAKKNLIKNIAHGGGRPPISGWGC
jgi:hypothetical protein